MTEGVSFFVPGIPQPQGSVRAFMPKGCPRPVLTSDNPKLKAWRKLIAMHARNAWANVMTDEPVVVHLTFTFRRPKSASVRKRPAMTVRPDLDKLARGVLDAMTGVVWRDDSQVTVLCCSKAYVDDDGDGVHVRILPPCVAANREGVAS